MQNSKPLETPAGLDDFEADTTFPSMSKILSRKENQKFGKHIVANADITIGKMVIAAHPFASIEYLSCSGLGCFACGKASDHKIKCTHCIAIWFCSNRCRANKLHQAKCDRRFESSDCQIIRLTSEMNCVACNLIGDFGILLEFCRGILFDNKNYMKCQPPFSLYGEILSLKGQENLVKSSIARNAVKHVKQLPQIAALSLSEQQKRILFSMAYRHADCIALNAFSEDVAWTKGGVCTRFYIFDIISRINHSCDPNIDHFLDDDDVTYFVASRPIKKGEQLFVNYTLGKEFQSDQDRKQYIKEVWNFECKCHLCCR